MKKNEIERRIMFGKFRTRPTTDSPPPDSVSAFGSLSSALQRNDGVYFRQSDGYYYLVDIQTSADPLRGCVKKIKSNDLPTIANVKTRAERMLEIGANEGLSQAMRFMVFRHDVVGWEYIHDGPRISILEELFVKLLNGLGTSFQPFVRPDIRERLAKIKDARELRLAVTDPYAALKSIAGKSISDGLKLSDWSRQNSEIEIRFKFRKPGKQKPDFGPSAVHLFYELGLLHEVTRARVMLSKPTESGQVDLDLFDDMFYARRRFLPQDRKHRVIADEAVYRAISEVYYEFGKDLMEG